MCLRWRMFVFSKSSCNRNLLLSVCTLVTGVKNCIAFRENCFRYKLSHWLGPNWPEDVVVPSETLASLSPSIQLIVWWGRCRRRNFCLLCNLLIIDQCPAVKCARIVQGARLNQFYFTLMRGASHPHVAGQRS